MRVMVTGAAGFIGSHLTNKLARDGHEVVAVDLLDPSFQFGRTENVVSVQADIRDEAVVAKHMVNVDIVLHQAALASVPVSFAEPIACMSHNVVGSTVIFEQARISGVRRVVMASTSAIYGDDPTPIKVETIPPSPQSPYAVSKLTMEMMADVYTKLYGLETVALRYFNVYGPGQPADGGYAAVIPAILKSIQSGSPFHLYGDGEQTRSFINVADVVRANILAATAKIDPRNGVVVANLAGAASVSINQLLVAFQNATGETVDVHFHPERPGDVKHSAGDSNRARGLFGFEATTTLEEGISQLVANPGG